MTRNKILAFLVFLIVIGSTIFFCVNVTRNNLTEQRELAEERWEVVQKYLATRSSSAREIGKLAIDAAIKRSIKDAADAVDAATDPKSAYLANAELDKAILSVEAQDVDDSNRFADVLAELETNDEKLKDAYKRYNEIVSEYNELVSSAPVNFLAEKLDFKPLDAFATASAAAPAAENQESTDADSNDALDETTLGETTENNEASDLDLEGAELLDDEQDGSIDDSGPF